MQKSKDSCKHETSSKENQIKYFLSKEEYHYYYNLFFVVSEDLEYAQKDKLVQFLWTSGLNKKELAKVWNVCVFSGETALVSLNQFFMLMRGVGYLQSNILLPNRHDIEIEKTFIHYPRFEGIPHPLHPSVFGEIPVLLDRYLGDRDTIMDSLDHLVHKLKERNKHTHSNKLIESLSTTQL